MVAHRFKKVVENLCVYFGNSVELHTFGVRLPNSHGISDILSRDSLVVIASALRHTDLDFVNLVTFIAYLLLLEWQERTNEFIRIPLRVQILNLAVNEVCEFVRGYLDD